MENRAASIVPQRNLTPLERRYGEAFAVLNRLDRKRYAGEYWPCGFRLLQARHNRRCRRQEDEEQQ